MEFLSLKKSLEIYLCTHIVLCAGYNMKEAIHVRSLQSKLTGTKL